MFDFLKKVNWGQDLQDVCKISILMFEKLVYESELFFKTYF